MASIVIDGLVLPISLTGHPVLDFCNTRAAWNAPAPKEYLKSHAHLTVWAGANGLLAPDEMTALRDAGEESVVARAIAFRSALYSLLVGPATADDWAAVNAEVARAGTVLAPGRPATWRLTGTGSDRPLLAIVWAAAGYLTTPEATRVSACPSHDCGWLFPNPTGRRRWCSMALCGNRAKVRRHAERARRAGTE